MEGEDKRSPTKKWEEISDDEEDYGPGPGINLQPVQNTTTSARPQSSQNITTPTSYRGGDRGNRRPDTRGDDHRGNRKGGRRDDEKKNLTKEEIIREIKKHEEIYLTLVNVAYEAREKDLQELYPDIRFDAVTAPKERPGILNVEFRSQAEAIKFVEEGPKPLLGRPFYLKLGFPNKKQYNRDEWVVVDNRERNRGGAGGDDFDDRGHRGGRKGGRGGGRGGNGGRGGRRGGFDRRDNYGDRRQYDDESPQFKGRGHGRDREEVDPEFVQAEAPKFTRSKPTESQQQISSKQEIPSQKEIQEEPPKIVKKVSNPFGDAKPREEVMITRRVTKDTPPLGPADKAPETKAPVEVPKLTQSQSDIPNTNFARKESEGPKTATERPRKEHGNRRDEHFNDEYDDEYDEEYARFQNSRGGRRGGRGGGGRGGDGQRGGKRGGGGQGPGAKKGSSNNIVYFEKKEEPKPEPPKPPVEEKKENKQKVAAVTSPSTKPAGNKNKQQPKNRYAALAT